MTKEYEDFMTSNKKGRKRINLKTKKIFVKGDVGVDGKLFVSYQKTVIKKDGTYKEYWTTPQGMFNKHLSMINNSSRIRAKRDSLPHKIDTKYLKDIFPSDKKCPVLGTIMEFGSKDEQNIPTVDKLMPSKGYVEGNLAWISLRANRLKNDATLEEIAKLHKYLKQTSKQLKNP